MSLNTTQLSNVNKIIGTNSLSSAVVRLYTTTGDDWKYTGIIGVATISKKNGFATISLVDLEKNCELFSEELYYNFNYQTPKPYFHHFEVGDCVAGFSFADDSEALNFSNQVNNNKPTKNNNNNPPQINNPPPQINTPPPQQTLTPIQQTPKQNPNPPSSQDKNKNKKKEGGGFFSKLFGGGSDKKKEEVHEISAPTNFRHESHIGWDPVNGFDIRNIPPAWKELFKKAGVKKSDLQDKETAKLVMETIVENIGGPPENTPPINTGNTPPPPPPNNNNNNNNNNNDNVPPPPMPPPPPTFDGPPPPMPPPIHHDKPNNNQGNSGGNNNAPLSFAEQLKMKQTSGLKTVDKVENLPQLPEDTGTLANALASALKNRRGAIEDERDSDDNNSGDEWSD